VDKEIDEFRKERMKRKRDEGKPIIIGGAIFVVFGIVFGIMSNWSTSMDGGIWLGSIGLGIILLVIGFGAVLYNSIKLSNYKG